MQIKEIDIKIQKAICDLLSFENNNETALLEFIDSRPFCGVEFINFDKIFYVGWNADSCLLIHSDEPLNEKIIKILVNLHAPGYRIELTVERSEKDDFDFLSKYFGSDEITIATTVLRRKKHTYFLHLEKKS